MVLPVSHSGSSAQSSDYVRFDFDNADRRLREKMHPKNTPPAAPHGLMPAAKTSKLILGKGLKRIEKVQVHTITYQYRKQQQDQQVTQNSKPAVDCLVQSTKEGQRRILLASNEAAETKYATDII